MRPTRLEEAIQRVQFPSVFYPQPLSVPMVGNPFVSSMMFQASPSIPTAQPVPTQPTPRISPTPMQPTGAQIGASRQNRAQHPLLGLMGDIFFGQQNLGYGLLLHALLGLGGFGGLLFPLLIAQALRRQKQQNSGEQKAANPATQPTQPAPPPVQNPQPK